MLYIYAYHATGQYELWEECYFGEENSFYLYSSVIVIAAVCIENSEIAVFHISNNLNYITQWKCYSFCDLFALLCTVIASIHLTNYVWYWKFFIYFCARLQTLFRILASVNSLPEYWTKINK